MLTQMYSPDGTSETSLSGISKDDGVADDYYLLERDL